ncbi:MAG: FlgD immunoglobulin-like domain containing protein, partial [Ignavibacteriaceae bacterium]
VLLAQETESIDNGSFWSGTAYYPISASGLNQTYKFFIENSSKINFENNIANRTLIIPQADTTIHWVYFNDNDNRIISSLNIISLPSFQLYQNFPNPFNPATTIKFSIQKKQFIKLRIFDLLGREIKTLIDEEKESGTYSIEWNGKNNEGNHAASGIYLIKLDSEAGSRSYKMVLLK